MKWSSAWIWSIFGARVVCWPLSEDSKWRYGGQIILSKQIGQWCERRCPDNQYFWKISPSNLPKICQRNSSWKNTRKISENLFVSLDDGTHFSLPDIFPCDDKISNELKISGFFCPFHRNFHPIKSRPGFETQLLMNPISKLAQLEVM